MLPTLLGKLQLYRDCVLTISVSCALVFTTSSLIICSGLSVGLNVVKDMQATVCSSHVVC